MSRASASPSTSPQAEAPAATPALQGLLARLRRELRWLALASGTGVLLLYSALALELLFWADWGLGAPLPVRLLLSAAALGLIGALVYRWLVRPLRSVPNWGGLAGLFERARPALGELYSSAVSLQAAERRAPGSAGASELVARVLAEAETSARRERQAGVLAPAPCWRRLALGLVAALGPAMHFTLWPELGSIFFARLCLGTVSWPQRTELELEIAPGRELSFVAREPERWKLCAARGSELLVAVRAHGRVPDEVELRFRDGTRVALAEAGPGLFHFRLAGLQQDLAFSAVGGDDQDGRPEVEVAVLSPPDVAHLAIATEPPAYTGLPPALEYDRDVRVPAGSKLRVHLLPEPRNATGRVRLLPEDRVIELAALPFPPLPAASGGAPGDAAPAPPEIGLAFELAAERSLRFRVELEDATGLLNPDPGLYAIEVQADQPPRVEALAPGRGAAEICPGGALPLRGWAEDDYGLAQLVWRASRLDAQAPDTESDLPPIGAALELTVRAESGADDGAAAGTDEHAGRPPRRASFAARLEVAALAGAGAELPLGAELELELVAQDVRAPEPSEGRSTPVRLRVVAPDELLRRLQDRLARARQTAQALWELAKQTRDRTAELALALEGDLALGAGDELALETCSAGQRRVQGDGGSLARELCAVAEAALYARLDPKAGPLLAELDLALAGAPELGFAAEAWQELARRSRAREPQPSGLATHLVALAELGLALSVDLAPRALSAVERVQAAKGLLDAAPALAAATAAQAELLIGIESLLDSLAEWDNFQSVLALSRDILERQKMLRDRTRAAAGGATMSPTGAAPARED